MLATTLPFPAEDQTKKSSHAISNNETFTLSAFNSLQIKRNAKIAYCWTYNNGKTNRVFYIGMFKDDVCSDNISDSPLIKLPINDDADLFQFHSDYFSHLGVIKFPMKPNKWVLQ